MKKNKKKKRNKLIAIGLLFIAGALALSLYNIIIQMRGEALSSGTLEELLPQIEKDVKLPDYEIDPNIDMPVVMINGRKYIGVVDMPSIDRRLPVISEWNYSNLTVAPCRYAGTPYVGDFVIAAHNYIPHFGTIKNLEYGDEVYFTDVKGNVFQYRVSSIEILQPEMVEEMKASGYPLTLFTCTIGGRTRVTVRCEAE